MVNPERLFRLQKFPTSYKDFTDKRYECFRWQLCYPYLDLLMLYDVASCELWSSTQISYQIRLSFSDFPNLSSVGGGFFFSEIFQSLITFFSGSTA